MFEVILQHIGGELLPSHGGGSDETDPSKKVLLFLWYLANQQPMREISHIFDLSMSTVHATLKRVNNAINGKLLNVIQWPDYNEQNDIAREFQLRCGLPDIAGVLDGTHIRLASCINGDTDYMNRKHFPSMQLQIVVDHDMLIRDIYTGWPGSTHDARVLRNSNLFTNANTGNYLDANKFIIADSAYPLKMWLITPFKDNGRLNAQQRRFNKVLSSARQVVERSIGHLKKRFGRLTEVTIHHPEEIVKTIVSGCILHNLCIIYEDSGEDFVEINDDGHPNHFPNMYIDGQDGMLKLQQFMQVLP